MAPEGLTDMIWEKMWVGRPGSTHLSQSRTSGGSSPLVRGDGTNKLRTHVTLVPVVDGQEPAPSGTVLKVAIGIAAGVVLGIGATIAARKAAPHFKRWWRGIRSKWRGSAETSDVEGQAAGAEIATMSLPTPADFSVGVDAALEEHRIGISSAEAQKRLVALLMAAAFIADEMRVLAKARIEDAGASPELESAMSKLTAPHITDSINRMLAGDASLLDEETSAEFMKIFGGGRFVGDLYVPVRNEMIRDALRLTEIDGTIAKVPEVRAQALDVPRHG